MKDSPKILMFIVIGFFMAMFILKSGFGNYKQDTTVNAMTETIRSTAISSRDDSARVKKGQFRIDKSNFERDFKSAIDKNKNIKLANPTYTFDYLDDGQGGVKAIKVVVKSDGNRKYQATTVLSNGKDK